jgi:DHA1 family tetracycline resistance protein-like MFS transporter
LAFGNAIFGYFVLPETVTDRIRRPFAWRRANPFGAFKALGQLPGVKRYLLLFFIYEFAFIVYPATWAYFTQERFAWGPGMVGFSLASFGISMALVQGGLIRIILKRFGETGTILYGFCFNAAAFLCLAFVVSPTLVLILTPLTALGAVVTPALQAMMSRIADDNQQGELQGVISSSRAVALIVSPLILTQIFAYFTVEGTPIYLPGAAFLLSMALMGLCLVVFLTRSKSLHVT